MDDLNLASVKTFLLDLDGTVYLGDQLYPWSLPFLERVTKSGRSFVFVTNNSSRSAKYYVEKLQRLGVPAQRRNVFTSGDATIHYLKEHEVGPRIALLGTPSLEEEFTENGFELDMDMPDAVVLGFDMTMTYGKMERACTLVRQGLPFYATHPDFNCPTPAGPIPDIGAMIAFIEASTGRRPKVIGKPQPEMVEALGAQRGLTPTDLAMVGDRLYTDIAMGQSAGITSILVLSGETKREDLAASAFHPDYVVENLGEITPWL